MRRSCLLLGGFLVLGFAPRTAIAQYVHTDIKTGKKPVNTVLILPPEAKLTKTSMKGSAPLVAESETMAGGLTSVIAEAFSDRGFTVAPSAFSADTLDRNSDLKYQLSDLQTRYDKLVALVKKKPKGVRTGRFSLGDEVTNVAPSAADVLVFVRAAGIVPTAGLKTFVIVTGMGFTRNYAKLDFSVVDAESGTILYFNNARVYGNFIAAPETMKESINKSLSEFFSDAAFKK